MLGPDVRDVLEPKFAALLDYALRVTKAPVTCEEAHVKALRDTGATDEEIHATVQVAAYFNYINRVADGLGVDLEPWMERSNSEDEKGA
ncbi:MAG: carboxymuconolactone decarboxylase family protein [Planctomycetes bacterium]|nr:carboxymuconolactone decarboxylase family protein [Planctomycetota bacterium]MCB9891128.1 carboxymuconolactone decarboxylase family protein [Planctomycetota bacterium]MCB9918895.1 carboxymuconolactone decarboxylase family protein [Planctomycetota bacterium]